MKKILVTLMFLAASFGRAAETPDDPYDWGEKTKFELGVTFGYPELTAGVLGARNLFGTSLFTKLYWGAFAQAGEIELGWSFLNQGNLKPYASLYYSTGNWVFLGISAPVGIAVRGQAIGGKAGLILNDLFVFAAGAGHGRSSADARTGFVFSLTAGISKFF